MKKLFHRLIPTLWVWGAFSTGSPGATVTWDGSTSGNWATSTNWQGNAVPVASDQLVFPATGVTTLIMVNNLPAGTTFNRMTFAQPGYELTGNAVTMDVASATVPRIDVTHTTGESLVNVPLTVSSPLTLSAAAGGRLHLGSLADISFGADGLTLSGAGTIELDGTTSGTGNVVMSGGGTYIFDASQNATGTYSLLSGGLTMLISSIDGPLVTSSGTSFNSIRGTVNGNATLSGDVTIGIELTVNGNLAFSTTTTTRVVEYSLSGTTPGLNYDTITVSGNVTSDTFRMMLDLTQTFPVGTPFVLIDKTGAGAISNTSKFLTSTGATINEGTRAIYGTTALVFSYVGGTGNDFTATVANNLPSFSTTVADQVISEDGSTSALAFTVADADIAAGSLTLTASSSDTAVVPVSGVVFGGSGANRTVSVTPAPNANGSAVITINLSDGSDTVSTSFTVTVNAVNDQPTISTINDQSINEDANTGDLAFTIGDVETAATALTVTASSSNTTLIPLANITFGGSGANRTVRVTPAANQSGAASVTVTVSDGALSRIDTFNVNVAAVNDVPTITAIVDQTINEDGSTGALAFTIGDLETSAASLTVTRGTSNSALIPAGNIVLGGSGANRTVQVTPALNQSGTASITLTVSDGLLSSVTSFFVTINPVNDAPTLAVISDRSTNEDTATVVSLSLGDVDTAATSLTLSATSSDSALVPVPNIVFSGTGTSRTATITPATNQSGSTTITLTVSDGSLTASQFFVLTVTAVNDAPTITTITDRTINEDGTTGAIGFTVGDVETAVTSLAVSVNSSNLSLVPIGNIVVSGTGVNRSVTVTPAANQSGTASITLSVSDGTVATNTAFTLTVNAVNDAPTIGAIADQTINEDSNTGAISFGIGDVETAASSLTLSATTSNATLVPLSNINFGGSGSVRTVQVTPVADLSGSASITVTVSDGTDSASEPFVVTVISVNDAPSFTKGPDQNLVEGNTTPQLVSGWATNISAGPPNESSQVVAFQITSVTGGTMFLSSPTVNTAGDLSFTLLGNAAGTALVTLRISDNGGTANGGVAISAEQTFAINVAGINDPPSFTHGPSQTVLEESGAQTIPGWATNISAGPSNEASQLLTFLVTNDSNALFAVQPAVSPTGTLTFTPAPNAFGTATVTVRLQDNGGTANGGVDMSGAQVFTITITGINDAPSFVKGPDQTVLEDAGNQDSIGAPISVPSWATAISPGPGESADAVFFEITGNTNPALFLEGPSVTQGGALEYRLAENAIGSASITLRIKDFGGTANGGVDVSATQTFSITVTPVNDEPFFTRSTAGLSVMEDAGPLTFAAWATDIAPGPATATDEAGQAVDFQIVSNTNPLLFSSQPAVSPTGTLTFTSAANASGTALVTVRIHDDGGTANGGRDTGEDVPFSITVNEVNDAPSFVRGANPTVAEDAGARTIFNWATAITGGEPGESVTFSVTRVSGSLNFAVEPTLSPTGTLTFTTALNSNGSATFDVVASDGTVNAAPVTLIITALPGNDQPNFTGGPNVTVNEDAGAQTFTAWATNIVPGPATATDEAGQNITFLFTFNTAPSLFSVQPEVSSNGTLTFTPAPNAFGVASLTVVAQDDGGTSPGIDTSPGYNFTITVNAVNDLPVGASQSLTTMRDAPLPVRLTATDFEGNPVTLSIVTQPSHGTLSNITSPSGPFGPMNLIYTPAGGYTGPDSFTFRGTDADPGLPATISINVTAPPTASGITRVWDGGAGTRFWADAANWMGDIAPQPGDSIQFPAGATGVSSTENNLPAGFVLNQIQAAGNFQVTGNGVNLLGGLESSSPSTVNWLVPVNFLANGFIRTLPSTPVGVGMTMQADVSTGPFIVTLEGSQNSPTTFAPLTNFNRFFGAGSIVSRGSVTLRNTSTATGVITGGIVVETGRLSVERPVGNRIVASGPVEVKTGAILQIGANSSVQASIDPIDTTASLLIREGGFLFVGPAPSGTAQRFASLQLESGGVVIDQRCTLTVSSNINVSGTGVSEIGIGSPFAAFVFDGTGADHLIDVAAGARLEINANSNAFATLPVRKTGAGTLDLNGRIVFTGGYSAESGDTNFFADVNVGFFGDDASQTNVTLKGGNVSGQSNPFSQFARKTGNLTSGPGGGIVTPAPDFTELRTRNVAFNPATTYRMEFLDSQVSSARHFDLMIVEGTLNLGSAQFEMIRPGGFQPPAGESIVIIQNDGTDPVVGTFAGMPQGHVTTVGNVTMQITYAGGDGNDVAILFNVLPTGITRVWDGGGATANWSEAANWAGDVAPQQGDSLEFSSSAAQLAAFNDLPNESTFDQIRFTGTGPKFQVNGNNIRFISGALSSGTEAPPFLADSLLIQVTSLADQSIVKSGTRRLHCSNWKTNGKILTLTDQVLELPVLTSNPGIQVTVGGSGNIIANGAGSVFLEPGLPVHTGKLEIRSGFLIAGSVNPRTAQTSIGGHGQPARLITFGSNLVDPACPTTISQGGAWELAASSLFDPKFQQIDNLQLDGGSLVAGENTRFIIRNSISTTLFRASSIQGEIQSGHPAGGSVSIDIAAGSSIDISGSGTTIGQVGGSFFTKKGDGQLTIAAPVTATRFDIVLGRAVFNGNASVCAVNLDGGTLAGNGSVGIVTNVTSGLLEPGIATGVLNTGDLALSGSTALAVQIGGATPGSGHDQVVAQGTVSLSGALLAPSITGGYTAVAGDQIVLIDNDGTDAVVGTFTARPEGTILTINSQKFIISYAGGDGNDVVLTATGPPVPPVLAISSITLPGAGGGNADGTFSGTVSGVSPGLIAELQVSSDLSSWTAIDSQTVGSNGTATFTNSVDTGSGTNPVARQRRFFRVVLLAPFGT
jgi:hypothetical protein